MFKLFRKSKASSPPPEEPPQRDIPVAIPARYVLRPNRSEFWWFLGLSLLFLLLLPAVLWDSHGEDWGVAALLGLFLLVFIGIFNGVINLLLAPRSRVPQAKEKTEEKK